MAKTPITGLLILINVLGFLFKRPSSGTELADLCKTSMFNQLQQMFTHIDPTHLLANMYTLYNLSSLEKTYGSGTFGRLVLAIMVMNVVINNLMHKYLPLTCAIGFSGVIFGLYMFKYFKTKEITAATLVAAMVMVIQPSIKNPRASFLGHLVGAFSGVVMAKMS